MKEVSDSTLIIRRLSHESVGQAAERCLEEKLNVEAGMINLQIGRVKSVDSEETSDIYPGLTSIVTRHIVVGQVATTDTEKLKRIGADSPNLLSFQTTCHDGGEQMSMIWSWKRPQEIPAMRRELNWLRASKSLKSFGGKQLQAPASPRGQGASCTGSANPTLFSKTRTGNFVRFLDSDVQVLTPWDKLQVTSLLGDYEATAEEFGTSLEGLCAGVAEGKFGFGHHKSSGKLVIIERLTLLQVEASSGVVLVQSSVAQKRAAAASSWNVKYISHSSNKFSWPTFTSRPYESAWDTARRMARTQLDIDDDALLLDNPPQMISLATKKMSIQEDNQIANSRWLQRKWLVVARINPDSDSHAKTLHTDKLH
eukprot:gnl/MRDRNA2_/MRDRNA2_69494_c0_seq1.p1 gnl/MRDRNA2_/MRDRNA2_69494_c0~~gnl/MRDRNA2_/MRDRNA2_69494_c0_seq1.p1  ORF type:complete len:368 (-),score=66.04 gnl/MRDRNA2_/MRDRNA2_69494_c0_seq1:21-1124(-)